MCNSKQLLNTFAHNFSTFLQPTHSHNRPLECNVKRCEWIKSDKTKPITKSISPSTMLNRTDTLWLCSGIRSVEKNTVKNKQISQNLFNIQDKFDYFEYLEINPWWVKPKCMLLHLENIAEETSHMKNTNRIATNQQCSKQHQQHLQQQKEPNQCRQRLFKLCSMMLHNKFKKKIESI